MGKRKRQEPELSEPADLSVGVEKKINLLDSAPKSPAISITVQIIVGTYEKVLHGVTATVTGQNNSEQPLSVVFADTFLLSPHGSAIRCLAISPQSSSDLSKSQKIILASGSSDQIINLYHVSAVAPSNSKLKGPAIPTLRGNNTLENPQNRELGSLQHHSASINALYFPTRSKLLSAADDNTIAVARTRDWTVLSTIKAPMPKAHGRPGGDTPPLGGTPAGVNDLAIHPSMKLMVSVGKGEKCMRLWNLVTGKKAGVLNFERSLLQGIGEGRWASGEGRRVEWNSLGEEFVVGFERGCVVFGMDSKPKCRILPSPSTKIHQMHYTSLSEDVTAAKDILAISTEDGRILFYSTALMPDSKTTQPGSQPHVPVREAIGQLGGAGEGLTGRIKDFEILKTIHPRILFIVTGSSDGAIRLWLLDEAELTEISSVLQWPEHGSKDFETHASNDKSSNATITQVGSLLGTYEAGNRITCLKAFIMSDPEQYKARGLVEGNNANRAISLEGNEDSNQSS
ncbi:hypothetical protein N7G274_006977 [Stereocaulon virgatum]|uniref:WD40 repeat-like protein n=1 Tax=Stereocaulon virgatum TaxID=373712 RepID=A0ABR4A3I9_9LECA